MSVIGGALAAKSLVESSSQKHLPLRPVSLEASRLSPRFWKDERGRAD